MDRFAQVCEEIAARGSRQQKVEILARYFASLSDYDFALAVRFLAQGPVAEAASGNQTLFDTGEKPRLSIGHSLLRDVAISVIGLDLATWRICHQEVGDTGETIGLLLRGIAEARPLSLLEANALYQRLFQARLTAQKTALLADLFRSYRPLTIKYFVKVITGRLRIGLLQKQVEEAVALSCGLDADLVREANNRAGDLPAVAMAARRGELQQIEARLFHPMDFMLAKPLERIVDLVSAGDWLAEDKYDGIRSHAHIDHGVVRIYSRGLEDISHSFPEIVEAFSRWPHRAILDGEILAWRGGRALSFNLLQQRISRRRIRTAHISDVPVIFMAYDLLYADGELLIEEPIEERRFRLVELFRQQHDERLLLSRQHEPATYAEIEALFEQARENGNEGLLLKRRGSLYEPSKRSGAWHKLKRPYGTLDVVITAAEQGHGKRASLLSDYTFAVRSGNQFVNVGKAYSGLTDEEVKQLTRRLRAATIDRFGRVMLVRPEVVLEVAFDGVQKSARHKGGYALRFPRIVRWRREKTAEDVDNLERVRDLYELSLSAPSGHAI